MPAIMVVTIAMFALMGAPARARAQHAEEQIAAAGASASSLSLVMVEEEGCGYCRKWHEEVGPGYPLSEEGHAAPLVRIDRKSNDAGRFPRVVFTPTFILVGEGKELGRINGYPGPDFFWSMLGDMLRKLDPAARPNSSAARLTD